MIHNNAPIEADDYKTITIGKLKALLAELPDDWEIWANQVKNLSVGNGTTWKGYIDIAQEVFVQD